MAQAMWDQWSRTMDTTNVVANDKPADDGAVSPHPDYKGEFIWIGDLIEPRRAAGEKPTVGPYPGESGTTPEGKDFTTETEVWELAVEECVIFRFPKNRDFSPAHARGIGDYLTMKRSNIEIMLIDDLKPTITGPEKKTNYVVGTAHIRVKRVTASHGDYVNWYLFVKLEPTTQTKPTHKLLLGCHPAGERSYGYDSNKMTVSLAEKKPAPVAADAEQQPDSDETDTEKKPDSAATDEASE
ncbi:MAG: hypothetical protein PHC53_05155 [Patescibacteria group bacterium]|nr:hypothetical protein [Patescibacteria group bacterium]